MSRERYHLLVCDGPSCGVSHESERFVRVIEKARAGDPALAEATRVWSYSCFGLCDDGPNVYVCPASKAPAKVTMTGPSNAPWPAMGPLPRRAEGGVVYHYVDEALAERIVREHCGEERVIEELASDL